MSFHLRVLLSAEPASKEKSLDNQKRQEAWRSSLALPRAHQLSKYDCLPQGTFCLCKLKPSPEFEKKELLPGMRTAYFHRPGEEKKHVAQGQQDSGPIESPHICPLLLCGIDQLRLQESLMFLGTKVSFCSCRPVLCQGPDRNWCCPPMASESHCPGPVIHLWACPPTYKSYLLASARNA